MILPSVVRSGRMPKRSWAPPGATRNEMTSSKIRRMPRRSVASRSPSRKPSRTGIIPPLASIGSTMRQAMSPPCFSRILTQAAVSFHGSTTTCFITMGGTPDDHDTDLGRLREPATAGSGATLTSTQSCVP